MTKPIEISRVATPMVLTLDPTANIRQAADIDVCVTVSKNMKNFAASSWKPAYDGYENHCAMAVRSRDPLRLVNPSPQGQTYQP